jgi:hypothetical protein
MIVNDVLENAAIENVSSLPATLATGRMVFLTTNSKMYVGNASKVPVVTGHSIGEIKYSMLTLAQFQAEYDTTWVLANGANVAGSNYATVTGNTNIPDLRGRFLRGKNNGRTGGSADPNGDLALGSDTAFRTGSPSGGISASSSQAGTHNHDIQTFGDLTGGGSTAEAGFVYANTADGGDTWHTPSSSVVRITTAPNHSHTIAIGNFDTETAPAYTVANIFIKINR